MFAIDAALAAAGIDTTGKAGTDGYAYDKANPMGWVARNLLDSTIAGLVCLLLAAMTGTMPFILMIVQTHMAQTLTRQHDDAVRNVAREARTRIPSYPLTPYWPTGSCSTNSTDSA